MPSSYTLGTHYEAFARKLVESGRYASVSEVLRDGLRLLEEQEQLREIKLTALREAIAEGESGPFEPWDSAARPDRYLAACGRRQPHGRRRPARPVR